MAVLRDFEKRGSLIGAGDDPEFILDAKMVHTGGVEWTIKDGISTLGGLMADVKEIVAKARAASK
jgi:hypothetical protein